MTPRFFETILVGSALLALGGTNALAAPCLMVTLTGTQSGPPIGDGRAGSGTLVRYGDDANNCGDVRLQFDTGRGTLMDSPR